MGEHSRVKVQPQFCSELILSILPEMRNKRMMSENVIELNKLNYLQRDWLTAQSTWKSKPPMHSQSRFISQTIPPGFFKWVLTFTLSVYWYPGIIFLDFIIGKNPNTTWINFHFLRQRIFLRISRDLRRKTHCKCSGGRRMMVRDLGSFLSFPAAEISVKIVFDD